jgi:uncharacterized protein
MTRPPLALAFGALLLTGCPTEPEVPSEIATIFASQEEVTVEVADLTLEGTLHLPDRDENQLVAGVVLVHGSGPNSRDAAASAQLNMGYGLEIEVFTEIAQGLQDAGYAVLRYDKRSCGTFNGLCDNDYPLPGSDIGVHDFADDGVAMAQYLSNHPEIDSNRVVIAGHSQGGGLLPQMLIDEPSVAAGISLAGPYRPIDVLMRYQLDFSVDLLEQSGATPAQIEAAVADLRGMVEDLEALRAGTFAGQTLAGLPPLFWQEWMDLGDTRTADLASLSQPILAVNGDYDWNVPADTELSGWSSGLQIDGSAAVELPCLTHSFNCISQPDWTAITAADIGGEVDDSLFNAVLGWLDDLGLSGTTPR